MKDKYLEVISSKIEKSIRDEQYFLAGQYFMDLAKYGIVIEDNILTMITSELSDVYRNSFGRIKEFKDKIDIKIIEKVKSNTYDLVEFLKEKPNEISQEKKIELFDILTFIISNAEKIQAETGELEEARILRKRIYREPL